jgi:hypothetical protein
MADEQNTQPMGKYLSLLPPLAQGKGNPTPVVNGKESGGGMWAVIEILEPTKINADDPASMSYYLHLPKELNNVFSVDWQQKELGSDVLSALFAGGKAGAGSGSDNGAIGLNAMYGSGLDVVGSLGVGSGAAESLRQSAGIAKNTVNTLLFQGSNLRNFQFTWDLIPLRKEDSKKYNFMIEDFRSKMHPRLETNMNFLTPYLFRVRLNVQNNVIISTLPCAMTNLTINAFGSGMAAFHSDGTPVHTVLTIELQELFPQTQQSIKKLYGSNSK